jgi:hypothetical protein
MCCSYDPWLQHTRKPWTCWSNKFVEEYICHNSYMGILCYLTNIGTSCQLTYCMNLAHLLVPITCMHVHSHTVQRETVMYVSSVTVRILLEYVSLWHICLIQFL